MTREIVTVGGHSGAVLNDNHIMTASAASPFKGALKAPFTRRAWAELRYTLVTLPLAFAAVAYIVPMLANGLTWALSAPAVRKFGAASRLFARGLLGEDVPAPPRLRSKPGFKLETPDAERLAKAVTAAGSKARVWETRPGVTVQGLALSRISELAAAEGITIREVRPQSEALNWLGGRILDPVTWRTRCYFGAKLPLAVAGLLVAAGGWLGGLFYLAAPVWWSPLRRHFPFAGFPFLAHVTPFAVMPAGLALLLAGPWLLHGITETDRRLVRGLLGPSSPAERIRALEESRARAVDDSAARLRTIERDLHDGTQAQLVALAMKLGLAMDKLHVGDLARVTQLVEDAHRGALEAIADLRTLARGIHPPVLDNGLADALATLVNRSAVPVELIADIPERPSDAIETIAYFSAAELLTNVAKHSGARHATLEAVHVPGLLRVRVSDDGRGGAHPVPEGGLYGLAERVRTVDGRVEIDSPRGGPTTVTVELPSHA
ncbi:MAG: sensor domain-containing protein [Streptosporangiaceae bacterium]|nr:sensor domain-containing protein [Streptosporangiaceae bacterium]